MTAIRRRSGRWACAVITVLLAWGYLQMGPAARSTADTLPPAGQPATASAVDLPTWQINGVAWAQAVVGNTVYVTGNFTRARPPGMWLGGPTEVPVAHLLAYDIRTGERIASFNHELNAQGLALTASQDGSRIYVGGDFTTVDNEPRGHIAAFDTATGALVAGFNPNLSGQVRALAVMGGKLYAGGAFEGAQGVARKRLASFGLSDGKLTSWAPKADNGYVWAVLGAPDNSKLIVAGAFTTIGGMAASGTAALEPDTGALLPWAMNSRIYVSGKNSAITNLSTDGTSVFGGGFVFGQGSNLEGTFSANVSDGALRWVGDCLGDTYSTRPLGGVLYVADHAHDCRVIGGFPDTSTRSRWEHVMALTTAPMKPITTKDAYGFDFRDQMSPNLLQFHPDLGIGQATGQYQASWHVEGNDDYVVVGGEFPTVNGRPQQGLTRFSRVPGATTSVPSFQTRPARTLTPPVATSRRNAVTVRSQSAWDADNATLSYELVRDRGKTGEAVVAQRDVATNFWTLPNVELIDPDAPDGPHTYHLKVTDKTGQVVWSQPSNEVTAGYGPYGKAVFADGPMHYWRLGQPTGDALDEITAGTASVNTGVTRGVAPAIGGDSDKAMRFSGTVLGNVITKSTSSLGGALTMEAWVRTTSSTGGRFVVLGTKRTVSGQTVVTNDRHLYMTADGRLGASVPSGAAQVESQPGFNDGTWHHSVATVGADGLTLYADGEKVAQSPAYKTTPTVTGNWYIGGDRAGTGPNWTTWALEGDVDEVSVYKKALSPTRVGEHYNLGAGTLPNQVPSAAFTSAVSGLDVALNGSGSVDSDGSIASYAWDFGDGSAGGSGVQVSHTYAAAGTYTVRLTVTDDRGASNSVTRQVSVTEPAAGDIARDAFSRSVTGGWGAAEEGGPWMVTGPAAAFAVDAARGSFSTVPKMTRGAQLPQVSNRDNDLRLTLGWSQPSTGGGIFTQVIARGSLNDGYGARLWIHETGVIRLIPFKKVAGADTDLAAAYTMPIIRHTAGASYHLVVQAFGSGTTTLRAKLWLAGTTEPANWMVVATDTTAGLQNAGGVGLVTYLSGTATTPEVTTTVDDVILAAVKP